MTKHDARSLSDDSLKLLRQQAHRLRLDGYTWKEISEIVGVHLSTVMKWSVRFDLGEREFSEAKIVSSWPALW
jgi:transposase